MLIYKVVHAVFVFSFLFAVNACSWCPVLVSRCLCHSYPVSLPQLQPPNQRGPLPPPPSPPSPSCRPLSFRTAPLPHPGPRSSAPAPRCDTPIRTRHLLPPLLSHWPKLHLQLLRHWPSLHLLCRHSPKPRHLLLHHWPSLHLLPQPQ